MAGTVALGVACAGCGAGAAGRSAWAQCPQEKPPASQGACRVRGVLGFRIKLHKTNGCKWPFPNLTMQ